MQVPTSHVIAMFLRSSL